MNSAYRLSRLGDMCVYIHIYIYICMYVSYVYYHIIYIGILLYHIGGLLRRGHQVVGGEHDLAVPVNTSNR